MADPEQVPETVVDRLEKGDTFYAGGRLQCGNRTYFCPAQADARARMLHSPLSDDPPIGCLQIAGNTSHAG